MYVSGEDSYDGVQPKIATFSMRAIILVRHKIETQFYQQVFEQILHLTAFELCRGTKSFKNICAVF